MGLAALANNLINYPLNFVLAQACRVNGCHYFNLIGPPGEPQVLFFNDNSSVCFGAYSNPSFPIQSYSVNITSEGKQASHGRYVFNASHCIILPLEEAECVSVQVSVLASNSIGNSTIIQSKYMCKSISTKIVTCTSFFLNYKSKRKMLHITHFSGMVLTIPALCDP